MKRVSLLIILICFILSVSTGYAAESAPLINPDNLIYRPLNFAPPKAERVELENGVILYILEDHELPLLKISAIIRTGSIYDPKGKEGLAEITGAVMRTGGTKNRTGREIDEELEYFAGDISISVNMESGSATLSVLKKDIDEGLDIFSDIIMNPVFDEKKLETARNLKIGDLRRVCDEPQKMAFREFKRLIYRGNERERLPSIKSVEKIERGDLIRFQQRFFYPGNMMMAVVGDITRDEAISKINRYFGAWNRTGKKIKEISGPEMDDDGTINYIYKEAPQSIIIMGCLAPDKKSPDFYPFTVLDFILGSGGFRSRIMREVRNSAGLAYSAGSFYNSRNDYGVFGAYAFTKSSSTAKVLSLIMSIIEDVRANKIAENELSWAKKSINNSFIFSFDSADKIAIQQMLIKYNKLPDDFLTTYRDRIEKVTIEDLKRVAKKYLSRNRATILIVGNDRDFDKPLSHFGKVKKIEAQGTH
jgi:predicted Zn-dependent peptidase